MSPPVIIVSEWAVNQQALSVFFNTGTYWNMATTYATRRFEALSIYLGERIIVLEGKVTESDTPER